MITALAILVLLFAACADAFRDGWMARYAKALYHTPGWWKRHYAKWVAFYPPLIFIVAVHVRPLWLVPVLAVAGYILWSVGLWLSGAPWEPPAFRRFRGWIQTLKKWQGDVTPWNDF